MKTQATKACGARVVGRQAAGVKADILEQGERGAELKNRCERGG